MNPGGPKCSRPLIRLPSGYQNNRRYTRRHLRAHAPSDDSNKASVALCKRRQFPKLFFQFPHTNRHLYTASLNASLRSLVENASYVVPNSTPNSEKNIPKIWPDGPDVPISHCFVIMCLCRRDQKAPSAQSMSLASLNFSRLIEAIGCEAGGDCKVIKVLWHQDFWAVDSSL